MSHAKALENLCLVCGSLFMFMKNSRKFNLDDLDAETKTDLENVFYLDLSTNNGLELPDKICFNCYTKLRNFKKRPNATVNPISIPAWLPHEENCKVCHHYQTQDLDSHRGGRKVKTSVPKGRPSKKSEATFWSRETSLKLNESIQSNFPDHLSLKDFDEKFNSQLFLCKCSYCRQLTRKPVVILGCEHFFCFKCLMRSVEGNQFENLKCPTCDRHLKPNEITPSRHINSLLMSLRLSCGNGCGETFVPDKLEYKAKHEKSCENFKLVDILTLPTTAKLPKIAEQAVASAIRHKMANSEMPNKAIAISSGGPRPMIMAQVPNAVKDSTEVSKRTLQRRNNFLKGNISLISGGATACQSAALLKSFAMEIRMSILKKANIRVFIDEKCLVAMRSHLHLSWQKMKAMSSWMLSFNIEMASHNKQRKVSREWAGDMFAVEMTPFLFEIAGKKGQFHILSAPWSYVKHLPSFVVDYVEKLDHENQLIHHPQMNNEIHIKLGGDHGGKSFKGVMQVCNTEKPNSQDNTVVFSYFEAKDYRSNLRAGFGMYTKQIDELQQMKWNDHVFRVFITGDYEFLCAAYGISGASGRHPCLFCTIMSCELKIPRQNRNCTKRTLESMDRMLEEYRKHENKSKAKYYENVIGERIFNVPLDQVALPALHISLGTFKKFYNLLERECKLIDLKIAVAKGEMKPSVIETYHRIAALENEIDIANEYLDLINSAMSMQVSRTPENEEEIYNIYNPRAEHFLKIVEKKQKEIKKLLKKQVEEEEKVGEENDDDDDGDDEEEEEGEEIHSIKTGPCTLELENLLQKLHICRQAYHGKSFIGNHVHKMLHEENIVKLCNTVPIIVGRNGLVGTQVHDDSLKLNKNFKTLFGLYSKCHYVINRADRISQEEIDSLQKYIDDLMAFFRRHFPCETITPKLHLLEDHAVDFMAKWGSSFGIYGEQGAESIHKTFNEMKVKYHAMPNSVKRVRAMLSRHYETVHPESISLRPPKKPRFSAAEE